ncbi:MAG: M14 family metallopeptidase [Phycisphaerales bacterium]
MHAPLLKHIRTITLAAAATCALATPTAALAQVHIESKVDIAFNRYYSFEQLVEFMEAFEREYPHLVKTKVIGQSYEGRDLVLVIINNEETGPDTDKPAMWIDGSIHANEIQASEVCLYTIWYLTKSHGHNAMLTDLIDRTAFYILPVVSPDSRVYWFEQPSTPNTSRQNMRPVDNDRDGEFDEDPPNDLDGDGSITGMWKEDPDGRWRRSIDDPRVFERVADDQIGGWTFLGQEGTDLDGDGRINEDGPGGDDMNRNWPAGWQPNYVQRGAGEYPLHNSETRAIADFILSRPNIGSAQAYHNTGGMILRGPGTPERANMYPAEDLRVYNALARTGEEMIPYYRYLIIHEDLYTVHGGFVNWVAETLGIISYTNELWTTEKYFQRDVRRPDESRQWLWRDRLAFGELFTDFTEYDHPQYGKILVGGPNKWSARITPPFMLEEECHRNFAFTMYHAGEMAQLRFGRTEVHSLGDNLWSVTFEIRNERIIPTRTRQAANRRIGMPDLLTIGGDSGAVLASGTIRTWFDQQMTPLDPTGTQPGRLLIDSGIPGRGSTIFRAIVSGEPGTELTVAYSAEKAMDISTTIRLEAD